LPGAEDAPRFLQYPSPEKNPDDVDGGVQDLRASAGNERLVKFVESSENDPQPDQDEDAPPSSSRIQGIRGGGKTDSQPQVNDRVENLVDEGKPDIEVDVRLGRKEKNQAIIENRRKNGSNFGHRRPTIRYVRPFVKASPPLPFWPRRP